MTNIINVDSIKDLIFNPDIEATKLSRLVGVKTTTLRNYRNRATPFESMPLSIALALQRVIDDSSAVASLVGLPRGIDAVFLKNGGTRYKASVWESGNRIYLGTFNDKARAISARNEYVITHRDQIRVSKKAKKVRREVDRIEITPELLAKVKATKGVSFYRDRNGQITGFRAEYMRDRKRVYLGKFDTFDDAKATYDKATK